MSKKKKEIKEEKKKKNRKKTEYIPLRGILGNATDYNIYPMNLKERAIGFFMGFAGGFVVIYVFFRVYVMSIAGGILMGYLFQKPFQNILIKRRKRTLLLQFKDIVVEHKNYILDGNMYIRMIINTLEQLGLDLSKFHKKLL